MRIDIDRQSQWRKQMQVVAAMSNKTAYVEATEILNVLYDLQESRRLLTEALSSLDDDPIACACEKVDGEGKITTPKFSGGCLFCRIRAFLKEEGSGT